MADKTKTQLKQYRYTLTFDSASGGEVAFSSWLPVKG